MVEDRKKKWWRKKSGIQNGLERKERVEEKGAIKELKKGSRWRTRKERYLVEDGGAVVEGRIKSNTRK